MMAVKHGDAVPSCARKQPLASDVVGVNQAGNVITVTIDVAQMSDRHFENLTTLAAVLMVATDSEGL